ncbi:unnamed protein product [Phyllotreta striolata]|uniref:C2H2-type domain-containing protein n=1 Tax=Phyllotreta striolata TaxID=444603 RepID=A0A9N9TRQ1_PHYSR|nr:unnamed protein product [Phyllotreta striolata]
MIARKLPEEQTEQLACNVEGCDMTFPNTNQLEWHNKKHDMMLKLSLINQTNETNNETPTPTRFIRNCEEVGLFQDLQNVNPFDNMFKKAADLAKNGVMAEFESANSNDSLHTPHILPHTNETPHTDDETQQSRTLPMDGVFFVEMFPNNSNSDEELIIIDDAEEICKKSSEPPKNPDSNEPVAAADDEGDKSKKPVIKLVPVKKLMPNKKLNSNKRRQLTQKECNRASQMRCRLKKKLRWDQMIEDLQTLREENKKLKLELTLLMQEHSKCPSVPTVQPVVKTEPAQPTSRITVPTTTSTVPITSQLPFLVQILPNGPPVKPLVTPCPKPVKPLISPLKPSMPLNPPLRPKSLPLSPLNPPLRPKSLPLRPLRPLITSVNLPLTSTNLPLISPNTPLSSSKPSSRTSKPRLRSSKPNLRSSKSPSRPSNPPLRPLVPKSIPLTITAPIIPITAVAPTPRKTVKIITVGDKIVAGRTGRRFCNIAPRKKS